MKQITLNVSQFDLEEVLKFYNAGKINTLFHAEQQYRIYNYFSNLDPNISNFEKMLMSVSAMRPYDILTEVSSNPLFMKIKLKHMPNDLDTTDWARLMDIDSNDLR